MSVSEENVKDLKGLVIEAVDGLKSLCDNFCPDNKDSDCIFCGMCSLYKYFSDAKLILNGKSPTWTRSSDRFN